jgi:hypothetical protein
MRIITGSNEAGMEMAKNLLISLKKVGIPLSEVDLYVFKRCPVNVDYGTNEFNRLTRQKLEVIIDALNKYKEVCWMDTDIIARSDFREDLRARGMFDEMSFQDGIKAGYCSGFVYIHSTPRIIQFLESVIYMMKINPLVDDENQLNAVLIPQGIKAIKLPYYLYPVGVTYFGVKQAPDALIVHNNYIIGFENKKKRFEEFGLWSIDDAVLNEVNTIFDWNNEYLPVGVNEKPV